MGHGLGLVFGFHFESLFVGVALEDALNDPIFGDVSKSSADDLRIDDSPFLLGVVIGTGSLFASVRLAFGCFVKGGVVLLLLPAMAHVAGRTPFAGTVVVVDIVLCLPVEARLR
jgi:hypothetical protein